jgi:SAM-dependent methyltransferase
MAEVYEYWGLMAESWDLLRGDHAAWPDMPFYRGIIAQRGGPALDVGCGTGRHMLDYLAHGLDLDGVDNSPEMLAILRRKAAALGVEVDGRLHQQDMAGLDLPRRYATIFVPSGAFMLLTDDAAAQEALRRFHAHLEPGGLLVASFNAKLWPGRTTPPQMQWLDWAQLAEQRRDEDGVTIRRWIRTRYDHARQLEHEENRYEVLRDGAIVESEFHQRSPCVRWRTVAQAVACFEEAGFAAVTATVGDTFDPAPPEQRYFKVFGSRS